MPIYKYSSYFVVKRRKRTLWMSLFTLESLEGLLWGWCLPEQWGSGDRFRGCKGSSVQANWSPNGNHLVSSSQEEEEGLAFLYLPCCELETASIVSNDNGAGWPKWLLFVMNPLTTNKLCMLSYWQVLILSLNVVTTKFEEYFKLCAEWVKVLINEKHVFGQWNYVGVVSRLPIASLGHRPMETHHVY